MNCVKASAFGQIRGGAEAFKCFGGNSAGSQRFRRQNGSLPGRHWTFDPPGGCRRRHAPLKAHEIGVGSLCHCQKITFWAWKSRGRRLRFAGSVEMLEKRHSVRDGVRTGSDRQAANDEFKIVSVLADFLTRFSAADTASRLMERAILKLIGRLRKDGRAGAQKLSPIHRQKSSI